MSSCCCATANATISWLLSVCSSSCLVFLGECVSSAISSSVLPNAVLARLRLFFAMISKTIGNIMPRNTKPPYTPKCSGGTVWPPSGSSSNAIKAPSNPSKHSIATTMLIVIRPLPLLALPFTSSWSLMSSGGVGAWPRIWSKAGDSAAPLRWCFAL